VVYAVTALDRLHHESKELILGIEQSNYFYDVNRGQAWAIEAIDYLYEEGIRMQKGRGFCMKLIQKPPSLLHLNLSNFL